MWARCCTDSSVLCRRARGGLGCGGGGGGGGRVWGGVGGGGGGGGGNGLKMYFSEVHQKYRNPSEAFGDDTVTDHDLLLVVC